jgi:RNA polymerase sigma-70 factor, ECF subfamily
VLREAFDYPYWQIADILQLKKENVRQLVSRARKRIVAERHEPVGAAEQRSLLKAFLTAAQTGDLAVLEELFAADVVSYSDGGGSVRAARIPVVGRTPVAKFVAAFAARFWNGVALTWVEANGQASVLLSQEGIVFALVTVSVSEQGIDRIMGMMNPTKLAGISASPGTRVSPSPGPEPSS